MSARPTLTLIATAGSRRAAGFLAAAEAGGLSVERIIDWRDFGSGQALSPITSTFVRVDTPGEDGQVMAEWDAGPLSPPLNSTAHGDVAERDLSVVGVSRRWYDEFQRAFAAIAAAARDGGAQLLTTTDAVGECFDKPRAWWRLRAAGIPVPDALPGWDAADAGNDIDALREKMVASGLLGVFAKPVHGSSGSGVLAVRLRERCGDDVVIYGALTRDRDGTLRNDTRIGRFTGDEAWGIVAELLPHGLHVERWIPKLRLAGRYVDVRVVVVAGRATHAVVRTSPGVITNLNLGHGRGDLDAFRAAIGPTWDDVLEVAEHSAQQWPDTLMLGVDVLVTREGRCVYVLEVNVFGDLLPRLQGLDSPRSTYEEQVTTLVERPWK